MKVSYYLNGNTIMASVSFGRSRLRITTGESGPIGSDKELQFKLDRIEQWFKSEVRRQENDGAIPTVESVRARFIEYMNRSKPSPIEVKSSGLIDFIPEYLRTAKTKSGRPYTDGTKGNYMKLHDRLKSFADETGYRVDFDTINEKFYDAFIAYLHRFVKKDTSTAVFIGPLKHVLNVALDRGVSQCIEQKKSYFRQFTEDSDQDALTGAEIDKIYALVLTGEDALIRDMFVLTCYTGFRYSDWSKYLPENIIESGTMIRVATRKTGEPVIVPLHPRAKEILDRHFKSHVVVPANDRVNRTMKRLFKSAGLTTPFVKNYTSAGKRVSEVKSRWEVLSAHSSRRSFVTNCKRAGMDSDTIRSMSGHKTEASFNRYIRIDKIERARNAATSTFFTSR